MIDLRNINENITLGLLDLKAFSLEQAIPVKRELERAGTRFLLKALLGTEEFELLYTPQNKPFIKDSSSHISISHSHDKLVIILNKKKNTGIDIELLRDKVIKIRHKFLNEREWDFAQTDIQKLITIWAAKEAMYKAYGLKEVDFKLHLSVREFDGTTVFGKLEKDGFIKEFHLVRELIDGYVMVYILEEGAAV